MNDFTKEELQLINYCFENISSRKFMADKNSQPLYLKVRDMIDNYCEHQWIKGQHLLLDIWCTKCGKLLQEGDA